MKPKLVSVPWISGDAPEHRGNFLHSTSTRDVQYLNDAGKLFSMNAEVKNAVMRIFSEVEVPAKMPEHTPPTTRPVISMEHLTSILDRFVSVSAVRDLAKAFKQ